MILGDTKPPVILSDNNATVAENQKNAITLYATDENDVIYSISEGNSSLFEVNATSGVVTFIDAPDYESGIIVYTFLATFTDRAHNASTQEVTIYILDIVESLVLKKTGQRKIYDEDGLEVLDGSIKDDGFYQSGVKLQYSRDEDNETVSDTITGLMWADDDAVNYTRKKWVTQSNYDAGDDLNTSGDTASTYCDNLILGGYLDWRLPTIEELTYISDKTKLNPAIDTVFQNVMSNYYWSSSTVIDSSNDAWMVSFNSGDDAWNYKSKSYYVRCVRVIP